MTHTKRTTPQDIQLSGIKHAKEAIADLLNDQAKMAEVNAELLAALRGLNAWGHDYNHFCACPIMDAVTDTAIHSTACQQARAALAKAGAA